MKNGGLRFFWVAVLVLAIAVFACGQSKKLTILHTNDTHSAMVPFETGTIPAPGTGTDAKRLIGGGIWDIWRFPYQPDYAGIARMATLIKRLRAVDDNVLALNAGDVFVGSFEFNKYFGYPELKIMENLYDAMELGNHEFDLGIDTLAGVLSGQAAGAAPVNLPILCANVDFTGTAFGAGGPLAGRVQPTMIKDVDGVKVGIFGLVTQEPQNYSDDVNARFKYPYEDANPLNTLWAYAGTLAGGLKQQGCDIVICLSHLGTTLDEIGLADNVPCVDVIVGGHSHDIYAQPIVRNGKIIVQAGSFGLYLGELKLNIDANGVSVDSWKLIPVDGRVKEDPQVRAAVNKVRAGVVADPRFGPVYSQIVAVALRDIPKSWPANGPNRDTPLGNLITDAFVKRLTKAGMPVDCALDVLGYEGADIFAGKVVGNNIMRAVPYGYDVDNGLDFKVVLVPLTPDLIIGGLEYAVDQVPLTSDLAVQASGLTFNYDSSKDVGQMVDQSSIAVGGAPLGTKPFYYVAMSDQVFKFLNALTGNQLTPLVTATGLNEYTIVRDYMKSMRFVSYKSEGRVKDLASATSVKTRSWIHREPR
ncbi:MAG TPA: 5'-nucleotidase C-terminal domain-containing protein [Terriglobales bacterium]|nr:5'-nucleotidase C-terminal domain-containing protein [Terriglobales bacterium]